MSNNAEQLPRRYPGLKPFERSQSGVFYGRMEDIQRLANLIVRERLVVMFAKSGIGKTSLLQAGVAPELEKQGFAPLFLRLDNTTIPLNDHVRTVLGKHPFVGQTDSRDAAHTMNPTLWENIKRLDFDLDGMPATPVLLLDQFEEVFTLAHSDSSRKQFLADLADLANEAMPEAVRYDLLQRFQSGEAGLTSELMQWWEKQPELRVVISIRSDFLHLLDDISPLIPNILRNRYQLQPLNRRQAQAAIEAPAAAAGAWASPTFGYHPESMAEILDFLAGRSDRDVQTAGEALPTLRQRDEIEAFNLQILCQHIEEKIIAENQPAGFLVGSTYYDGHAGLDREIRDFYQKQLQNLPETYARRTGRRIDDPAMFIRTARCLIEESLVTPVGRRCSMVDDFLTNTWSVNHDFLDTLVETRLLRKELRLDDYYYEISHDTLLPAIITSRDTRRNMEQADREKAELEQRLLEEAKRREATEAQIRDLSERRRLARRVAVWSVASLILTLIFAVWFGWNWVHTLHSDMRQASRNAADELYNAAVPALEELASNPFKSWVLSQGIPPADPERELGITRRFQQLHHSIVQENLFLGDSLFFKDEYALALHHYYLSLDSLKAYDSLNHIVELRIKPNRIRVDQAHITEWKRTLLLRSQSTLKTMISQFSIRQRMYETFYEAGAWNQALYNLQIMQQLLPEQADDLDILQSAVNLNQNPKTFVQNAMEDCRQKLARRGIR
ncbi:MAG: hypothetical protein IT270_05280 [Saprospiraceae bacterium]|nr:hypothetical protein [Saprospiraceae bacterium]